MYEDPFLISSPGKLIGLQFFLKTVKAEDSIVTVVESTDDTTGSVHITNVAVNATTEENDEGESFPPGRVISCDIEVDADSEAEQVNVIMYYTTTLSGGERLKVSHPLNIRPAIET